MTDSLVKKQVRLVLEQQCAEAVKKLYQGAIRLHDFTLVIFDTAGAEGNWAFRSSLRAPERIDAFMRLLESFVGKNPRHAPHGIDGVVLRSLAEETKAVLPAGVCFIILSGNAPPMYRTQSVLAWSNSSETNCCRPGATMSEKPTYEELETNAATQAHINLVRICLRKAAVELLKRGEVHDLSKFSPEEVKAFTEFTPKLRGSTYGSQEYKDFLCEMKPALDHHYARNSHHPEFYDNGIDGMNLFDLVECFFDWLASTKRHADGDIERSIDINAKRFAMTDQLASIFRNTARDLVFLKIEES